MDALAAYLPIDRRLALSTGASLPDRSTGALLFADIAGFTPLTEGLARELGPQRGAEELTRHLDEVYASLVEAVHRYRGSVVAFGGDAITCYFDADDGLRAATCALAIHEAMAPHGEVVSPAGTRFPLAIKVAVAEGPVRRFALGDPDLRRMDVVAGRTLDQMADAEKAAEQGETLLTERVVESLAERAEVGAWRQADSGRVAPLLDLRETAAPEPWPSPTAALAADEAGAWLWPSVRERVAGGQREFLSELRPAVALFLQFGGLDYDEDPRAGEILDDFVRALEAVLDRHGGTLLELSFGDKGSSAYAGFGAPQAYADDAARAVGAALEILALGSDHPAIGAMRIGLARGSMRTGAYGSPERASYSVMGDRTNLAARLMTAAEPGTILCDNSVADRAERHWQLERLSPMRVKGKTDPVSVFRPSGQRTESAVELTASDGKLLGREEELVHLDEALALVEAGGQRVLGVVGEGGIGKSRLIAELVRDLRSRGLRVSVGAGQSIEQHTAYRAWRDVLRDGFDLYGLASDVERRHRVEAHLEANAPRLRERVPLLEDILALGWEDNDLTSGLDPSLRRDSLADLVLGILRSWGLAQPCMVVLDDAQWLDDLSWALVVDVVRGLEASRTPFLLVISMRPEGQGGTVHHRIESLTSLGLYDELTLQGLAPEATVALAAQKLGSTPDGFPKALSDLIQDRAEGNPFYAEELVLALRDRGALRVQGSESDNATAISVELIDDAEHLEQDLPSDIKGLVLARVDRLSPDSQLVLKMASVIGRRFHLEPLEHVLMRSAGQEPGVISRCLDRLIEQDLTVLESDSPQTIYAFRHIITQEATYETLLFEQRRGMHRDVAGWYEHEHGAGDDPPPVDGMKSLETYYPLLAHHYRRAEVIDRELIYGVLAGEHAAGQFANQDALRFFDRTMEIADLDDSQMRFRICLGQEGIHDRVGDRDAQAESIEIMHTIAQADGQEDHAREVALRRANLALVNSDFDDVAREADLSLRLAKAAADDVGIALAQVVWSKGEWQRGNYAVAREMASRALELAEETGKDSVSIEAMLSLAAIARQQQEIASAKRHYQAALRRCRLRGDAQGEAACLVSLAAITIDAGDFSEALQLSEEALALCRQLGLRRGQSIIEGNIGAHRFNLGDLAVAEEHSESALLVCRELGDRWGEGTTQDTLGLTRHFLGELDEARIELEAALAIQQEIEDQHGEAFTRTHLGDLFLDLGELDAAAEQHQAALDQRHELGQEAMAMDNHAGLARVALARGDLREARAQVSTVLAWIDESGTEGMEFPVLVEWTCCRVLRETAAEEPADAALAEAALERAHALVQERAEGIADEELRRGFLENVPFNREVEAAWAARETGEAH